MAQASTNGRLAATGGRDGYGRMACERDRPLFAENGRSRREPGRRIRANAALHAGSQVRNHSLRLRARFFSGVPDAQEIGLGSDCRALRHCCINGADLAAARRGRPDKRSCESQRGCNDQWGPGTRRHSGRRNRYPGLGENAPASEPRSAVRRRLRVVHEFVCSHLGACLLRLPLQMRARESSVPGQARHPMPFRMNKAQRR